MGVTNRSGGGSAAPSDIPVITTVSSDDLTGEVALASLTDGILKHSGGTPATASAGTDYFKPGGVAGGQQAVGGTASGEALSLSSTAHATKGKINLGTASAYDEVNDRLGIGTTSPTIAFDVTKAAASVLGQVKNTTDTGWAQFAVSETNGSAQLMAFGQNFAGGTTNLIADSGMLRALGNAGLTISAQATNANAIIRFCTNGSTLATSLRMSIDNSGNVILGNGALATTATDGFLFLGACAGTPTGVPAASPTGRVPLVIDSTNSVLYAYISGTWTAMGTVANNSVTYAKMQDISATDRLLGRDTAGAGDPEEITVGGGIEFTGSGGIQRSALSGDVSAPAGSGTTTIGANKVLDSMIRQSAACSVIGRSANSTGDVADVTASANDTVLLRRSNALTFGNIETNNIAGSAVTVAKMQDLAGLSVLGRSTNSTGAMAAITGTDGQYLKVSGTTLGFGSGPSATAAITDFRATGTTIGSASFTSIYLAAHDGGVFTATTCDGSLNRLYAYPFVAPRSGTIDGIYTVLNSTTASNIRLAMWSNTSTTNLFPNALLQESGAISCSSGTVKSYTGFSQAVTEGTVYWLSVCSGAGGGGTPDLKAIPAANCTPIWGFSSTDLVTYYYGVRVAHVFGAMPSTFATTGTTLINSSESNAHMLGVHYSA